MTFIHPLLLGGLLLAGIPILLHLTMRQKPKRLPFPAFRFLVQKHRTNQRSLRLRHLLLLALRVGLIAFMCLALARPRLFSGNIGLGQRVAAVMLFDTSPSMEYTENGKTRLEEARQRAGELLDELPPDSRVAILDSADVGGEWCLNLDQARQRLAGLKIRHANSPLPRSLGQTFRLFKDLESEVDENNEPLPHILYVFSDRTVNCWEPSQADGLHLPADLQATFVDVGVDRPSDVAIVKVEPEQLIVAPGQPVQVKVTVRATGAEGEMEILCLFDEEKEGEVKSVSLQPGGDVLLSFERQTESTSVEGKATAGLKPGWHQVTVQLRTNDALPGNNTGFCTVKVQPRRRVLVIADQPEDASMWQDAINSFNGTRTLLPFQCEVLPTREAERLNLRDPKNNYSVVCLFNVASPTTELWDKLLAFVRAGGGLAVIPGSEEAEPRPAAYKDIPSAERLLPAHFETVLLDKDKKHTYWQELAPNSPLRHRFLAPVQEWKKLSDVDFLMEDFFPSAKRSWKVRPLSDEKVVVVAHYQDGRPALLERIVDKGKVLQFTTTMDGKSAADGTRWNNYWPSFFAVLANLTASYLAGDTEIPGYNFVCGQSVQITLPAVPYYPLYQLQGPGMAEAESIARAQDQYQLSIPQAVTPGNYRLYDQDKDHSEPAHDFSLNDPAEENQLDRVPIESIEKLLGAASVLPISRKTNFHAALESRWQQPLELFPWLMLLLLFVLAFENLLSNKFYRRGPGSEEQGGWQSLAGV